jgi:hypothetical protein
MMLAAVPIHLRWLDAEQGGRKTPFAGTRYAPTARFAGESNQFSVVLDFPQNSGPAPATGTLRLLFPDLADIQQRISPGARLEILEGSRIVAQCHVD